MNWSKIERFSAVLIESALNKISNFVFCVWGTIWVWIDEIKKALKEMSALEFAKIVSKAVFYSFCVACWIFIFFGITFVGWAII